MMGYYRKLCCVVSWKKLAELKFEIAQEVRTGKRRKSNWIPVVSGDEYRVLRGEVNEGLEVMEVVEVVEEEENSEGIEVEVDEVGGFCSLHINQV